MVKEIGAEKCSDSYSREDDTYSPDRGTNFLRVGQVSVRCAQEDSQGRTYLYYYLTSYLTAI